MARQAEAAGFEAIFAAEVNNDVLGTVQLMGTSTKTIKVGSWVANIFLRHSYLCAKHAALIADATGGRMILGLGISHQPVNSAIGIDMTSPVEALRAYTNDVADWLKGDGPATHLPQVPAAYPVPIHRGLTSRTVELAGELADGVMPFLWSAERIAHSKSWAARGRARAPERGKLEIALGLPIFVGDDVSTAITMARANLGLFASLPFFHICCASVASSRKQSGPSSVVDLTVQRPLSGCGLPHRSAQPLPRTSRRLHGGWSRSADPDAASRPRRGSVHNRRDPALDQS